MVQVVAILDTHLMADGGQKGGAGEGGGVVVKTLLHT